MGVVMVAAAAEDGGGNIERGNGENSKEFIGVVNVYFSVIEMV